MWKRIVFVVALVAVLFLPNVFLADQVSVRYTEGLLHGFLALRTLEGKSLAVGDLTQTADGDRVTSKLAFKFKDGSVHEETTVFSQRNKFQVIEYHLLQKGPAFKRQLETSIHASSGQVTVHYAEEGKEEKVLNERLELGPDFANGIVPILVKNLLAYSSPVTVSMIVTTPKPKLVKVAIVRQGEEPFSIGGVNRKAAHFVAKVELGPVAGVVAPLVGKEPTDFQLWISSGDAPVFLRSEGQLFEGGPIWRIEQITAAWPRKLPADNGKNP
ncbi:MAG TPA: hypothetical protein VK709_14695 [Candidatus Saccharimonadales bacterium]|jgi:hypothetical protein|nr:hypothetical protein [Candidatus Saccharimonadales bacterium]